MGMSASQGRLLSITARMSDVEFSSQQISQSKIQLAMSSEEITRQYTDALDQKKFVGLTGFNQGGAVYADLSYELLTGPKSPLAGDYCLTDASNKVLVTEAMKEKFAGKNLQEFLTANGVDPSTAGSAGTPAVPAVPRTPGRPAIPAVPPTAEIPATPGTPAVAGTIIYPAGHTEASYNEAKTNLTNAVNAAQVTVNNTPQNTTTSEIRTVQAPGTQEAKTKWEVAAETAKELRAQWNEWKKGGSSNRPGSDPYRPGTDPYPYRPIERPVETPIDLIDVISAENEAKLLKGLYEALAKQTVQETVTTAVPNPAYAPAAKALADAQAALSALGTPTGTPGTPAKPGTPAIPATPGSPAVEAIPGTPGTPGKPAVPPTPGTSTPESTYYTNLFNRMTQGYTTNTNENINNSSWINNQIKNGGLFLEKFGTDGKTTDQDWQTSGEILEKKDDSDVTSITAKYNAAMQSIQTKDKKFDLSLKQLDTEHSALQTEVESVKKVIQKNIESSFKTFG